MNKSVLFALCAFIRVSIRADIYLYIDKMGDQHFSEHQENTKYKLLLRSESNHVTGSFKNWKEKSYRYVSIPQKHHLQNKYHPLIMIAAQNHQLEPAFIHAVITAESAYNHKAVSSAGAQGLMQLIPATADRFGVKNSYDPKQNIRGGVKYLRFLHDYFNGDLKKMIAGYNAGEGAVTRYKGIPPYKETIQYVKNVLLTYDKLRAPSLASAKLAKKRLAQAKRDRLAKASLADKIRKQTARPTNKTKKVRHVYQPPRLGLKPGRGGWQYNRARALHLYKK